MHIFLIGFMATGKSTVGSALAELVGLPFVDLDDVIEADAELTIAEIFAEHGEARFRALERDALQRVCDGAPAVVATGGGAPCHHSGIERMKAVGFVAALTAPLDQVRARVDDASTRPLLALSDSELASLVRARAPTYRRAHVCVPTEQRTPGEVSRAVAGHVALFERLPQRARTRATIVGIAERAYPIVVDTDGLDRVAEAMASLGQVGSVGLVSDDNVAPLYLARVRASLEGAGFAVVEHVIGAGESSKRHEVYAETIDALVAAGLNRRSTVVALGGGVVGDLAGFVAATLYRGVACVQIPTTVVAMVDSAVGGKTGINISAGKNLVGAFWQPSLVFADPCVLETLPARERRAAFGELIKYGLLDSEELYLVIDELAGSLATDAPLDAPTLSSLAPVIERCAAIKSWIVTRDEREQTGERALLNLGHTVGHAIEVASGYGSLLHGEAVGLGLVAACRVSHRLGMCDPSLEQRVVETLTRAGLDADLAPWLRDEVLSHVKVDKKRTAGGVSFVTLRNVGDVTTTELGVTEVSRILRR